MVRLDSRCTLILCTLLISGCDTGEASDPPAESGGSIGFVAGAANAGMGGEAGMGGVSVAGGAGGSGAGGAAAQGGSQGGAGAANTMAPDPVHVVHGFLPNEDWLTVVIQAYGMTQYEGLAVYVRAGQLDRPEWSRCWGSSRIAAGGFSITLPDCDEVGIYKRRLAFVDVNQDGVCNEVVYGTNAAVREDATFTLADSTPPPPAEQAMDTLFTEGDCAAFNEQWPEQ